MDFGILFPAKGAELLTGKRRMNAWAPGNCPLAHRWNPSGTFAGLLGFWDL
jgi:hypothetical protein